MPIFYTTDIRLSENTRRERHQGLYIGPGICPMHTREKGVCRCTYAWGKNSFFLMKKNPYQLLFYWLICSPGATARFSGTISYCLLISYCLFYQLLSTYQLLSILSVIVYLSVTVRVSVIVSSVYFCFRVVILSRHQVLFFTRTLNRTLSDKAHGMR